MFHPVGSQNPGIYWRRRLVLLAAVIVVLALVWLTVLAILDKHGEKTAASGGPSLTPSVSAPPVDSSSTTTTTTVPPSTSQPPTSSSPPSTPATTSAPPPSTSAAPVPCAAAQLSLQAVAEKPTYAVGDQPVLGLKVTNTGPQSCVQDVADSQIELRVYNGAARVWGSHDCVIEPGTTAKVLEPNNPATFTVQWTGLSSQPKCAGTRQKVGAGTYTLYGTLAGKDGKATNFSIS
ncbi:MAG TPA: hypothetical protein VGL26_10865 [Jatrophihabitans sp.]|jgi:hypothetical protein